MPPIIKSPGTPLSSVLGQLLPTLAHPAVHPSHQQLRTNKVWGEKRKKWLSKRERDAEKQQQKHSKLPIPLYDSVSDIKYADFVSKLQDITEDEGEVDRSTVERALRQYFVDVYGESQVQDFTRMYDRQAKHPGLAAWSRLRDETTWYWKRR